jgi:hypothetical protein
MSVYLANFGASTIALCDDLSKLLYSNQQASKALPQGAFPLEIRRIDDDGSSSYYYYINEISIRQGAANLAF